MKSGTIQVLAASLIIVGTTFVLFSGTISYEYLNWDDDIYVQNNEKIRSLENVGWWFTNPYYYSYIPITMLSHSLDYFFWGNAPRGHHLTNVVLHSLNAGLVFVFGFLLIRVRTRLRSTGEELSVEAKPGPIIGMAIAALLFAFHPLRAESVGWVSDRKDLLSLFFLLPSGLCYLLSLVHPESAESRRFRFASLIFFVPAVLSKGTAAVFPAVLVVLDWLLLPGDRFRNRVVSLLREKIPFFIVSLVLFGVYLSLIEPEGKLTYAAQNLHGFDHVLFAFYTLFFYLSKLIVPIGLSPLYPAAGNTELVVGLLTFIVMTLIGAFAAVRGKKEILGSWIIYAAFVLPTVVGLSSGMQAQADRFTYLATIPLFLLAGGGVVLLMKKRSTALRTFIGVTAVGLLGILGILTIRQTEIWRSSENLWEYVVHTFPPRPDYLDAYVNLGEAYTADWELPKAQEVFEIAVGIDSTNSEALYGLGYVVYLRGEWEQAAEIFAKLTVMDSTNAKAFFSLAVISSQLNRDEIAVPAMRRSAQLGNRDAADALRDAGIPMREGDETSIPLDRN